MANTSDSKPEDLDSTSSAPATRSGWQWFYHDYNTGECTDPTRCPICHGMVSVEQMRGPNGLELHAKARQRLGPKGRPLAMAQLS